MRFVFSNLSRGRHLDVTPKAQPLANSRAFGARVSIPVSARSISDAPNKGQVDPEQRDQDDETDREPRTRRGRRVRPVRRVRAVATT